MTRDEEREFREMGDLYDQARYALDRERARADRLAAALRLVQEAVRAVGGKGHWDAPGWNLIVPAREATALFDIAYGENAAEALREEPAPATMEDDHAR